MKKTLIFGFSVLALSGTGLLASVPASAETTVPPTISGYVIRAEAAAIDTPVVTTAPRIRVAPVVSVPAPATLVVSGERIVNPDIVIDEVPNEVRLRISEPLDKGFYDRPVDDRPVGVVYQPWQKWVDIIGKSLSARSLGGKRRLTQNDIRKAVLNTPCSCEVNLQQNGVIAESTSDGYQAVDMRLVRGRLHTQFVMS